MYLFYSSADIVGDLCSYNVLICFGKLTNDKINDKSSVEALGCPNCCQRHPVSVGLRRIPIAFLQLLLLLIELLPSLEKGIDLGCEVH